MKASTCLLFAALSMHACLFDQRIGATDDTGTRTGDDAAAMADSAAPPPDTLVLGHDGSVRVDDASIPGDDASVRPDAVTPRDAASDAPPATSVRHAAINVISVQQAPVLSLSVKLSREHPSLPALTLEETVGPCRAYRASGSTPGETPGLNEGHVVTWSAPGLPPRTAMYTGDAFTAAIMPLPAAGTALTVTITGPGLTGALTQTVAMPAIRTTAPDFESPTPFTSAIRYTMGEDLRVAWSQPVGDVGQIVFVATQDPNPPREITNMSCELAPSLGAFTVPWSMLARWVPATSPLTGIDNSIADLRYVHTTETTQGGVEITTTSMAVMGGVFAHR